MRHLLRKQDRLSAIELHPQDFSRAEGAVCRRLIRSASSNSTAGWRSARICRRRKSAAWCWSIRPSRRRANSTAWPEGLRTAHRRWPGGIYALWYPVKDRAAVSRLPRGAARSGIPEDPRHGFRGQAAVAQSRASTAAAWWSSIRPSPSKRRCAPCCRRCVKVLGGEPGSRLDASNGWPAKMPDA